jgi:hypothetical protein
MTTVKLLIALKADDTILVQISENEKALAHIALDRVQALAIANEIKTLAERIKR